MSNFMSTPETGSSGVGVYEMRNGTNAIRLIGDVIPRYVYWTEDSKGKRMSVECLDFNREKATFDRKERDPFREHFPFEVNKDGTPVLDKKTGDKIPKRASWAYVQLCLDVNDPENPELKVFFHKKKLFAQMKKIGAKLGDPTDPETGWDVVFEREKTGPLPFNVDYTLDQLGSSERKRPLTEAERELVEEASSVHELFPRPTPEEVEDLIQKRIFSDESDSESEDEEAINELEGA